ncbi:MAG: nucleotidyltransferase family protein [Alphaproteobacteria bacterium]|nr:nucleotidyltransferase family protein [Alphaproteobacteria bacterium]
MSEISSTAMVLAAGYGMRMRPLTLETPKPLLKIGSRTMLDIAIDRLVEVGISRVVVNCFYLAEQIEAHLASRNDVEIIISRENELLDTGGGIKNAIEHFGGKPFFALNSDLPWFDVGKPSLQAMAETWNAEKMDALLLLMSASKAKGWKSGGDFMLEKDGTAWRKDAPPQKSHVMLSAQIVKPELFIAEKETVFSNNKIWNKAESKKLLFGIEHKGSCHHVGTPEDLAEANRLFAGKIVS